MSADQACIALHEKRVADVQLSARVVPHTDAIPGYCKVNGRIAPALNFELRLPQNWNGKLYYAGGGGYNGSIPAVSGSTFFPKILTALKGGYAVVASDSGHQGKDLDASFALNNPAAAQLFGSESVPQVMYKALAVLHNAYGRKPERSYFEGCSNGGREGLMSVQRHPTLFDGVIAEAPAYNWVGWMAHFHRNSVVQSAPGAALSNAQVQRVAQQVRNACDALDGLVDGVVSNAAACTPERMQLDLLRCGKGKQDTGNCLSKAQFAVLDSWREPLQLAGEASFRNPGWRLSGNEDDTNNWPTWLTGSWLSGNGQAELSGSLQNSFQDTTVKNYLARDANANSLQYQPFDQNPTALAELGRLNDATNPHIQPFLAHGGKLILWHGGSDTAVNQHATVDYYNAVQKAVGTEASQAALRLYIAPGVNHCAGGAGADNADLLAALDAWVVANQPPLTLMARKLDAQGSEQFTRPLCQYPQYPRYTGPSDNAEAAKQAANFRCTAP